VSSPDHSHQRIQLLVLFVSLLAILAIMRTPPSEAIIAPPDAVARGLTASYAMDTAPPQPSNLQKGSNVADVSSLLELRTSTGAYTQQQLDIIAPQAAEALHYVSARTGMQLAGLITIRFEYITTCQLNGITYPVDRLIVMYVCPNTPIQRAVNILAHELVHQLAHDYYGPAHLQADLILSEGLATWGAGDYWIGGATDSRAFVRRHYARRLLPLTKHYRDYGALDAMNQLYYQWAALVDWIITAHGRDAFDQLYVSGRSQQPGSANYHGILGQNLEAVEQQWRSWIQP
jgi:hypothetical protein